MLRYCVAVGALRYGLIKLFPLQMGFPTASQLATPLGDLLPMRLSWLFIGYSTPYQMFSGAAETLAGLFLLPRRTVTLGLIAATAAFVNVVMINLAYDVPVKLYASHLLVSCVLLLAFDAKRLIDVLVLNRAAAPTALYAPPYLGPRWTWTHRVLKGTMVALALVMPAYQTWQQFRASRLPRPAVPLAAGV